MNKIVSGADEAIHDINSGATIMLGGFGLMWYSGKLY